MSPGQKAKTTEQTPFDVLLYRDWVRQSQIYPRGWGRDRRLAWNETQVVLVRKEADTRRVAPDRAHSKPVGPGEASQVESSAPGRGRMSFQNEADSRAGHGPVWAGGGGEGLAALQKLGRGPITGVCGPG